MSADGSFSTVTALDVRKYGTGLMTLALVGGLLLTLAVTWLAPALTLYLPVLLLLGAAGWYLFRHPTLNLCVVLALFPLVADFEEGIDFKEVAFGLYYLAFLAHWYFTALLIRRRRLLKRTNDYLVVFIVFWVLAYVPLSLVLGGDPAAIRSETLAFTMLGFYFPVREMVARQRRGMFYLVIVLLWIGLFVTLRNLVLLRELLAEATMAWQVTQKGRVATNEILIVVPAFAMLALTLHTHRKSLKAIGYPVFLALVFGLVMTQSRGYWVAFALGTFVFFLLVERKRKVELIGAGLAGVAVSTILVFILFEERALLLFAGLFNRVLSLATATTQDVSLVNRFLESKAVVAEIFTNPIVGLGMGHDYSYYNLTIAGTRNWSFIHNGYLSLWYRFGIVGLVVTCAFWFNSIRVGVRSFSMAPELGHRVATLTSVAGLTSMLLSAMTSTPFYHNDLLLMFGLLPALAVGAGERATDRTASRTTAIAPKRPPAAADTRPDDRD